MKLWTHRIEILFMRQGSTKRGDGFQPIPFVAVALAFGIIFANLPQAQAQQGRWNNYFNESKDGQREDTCPNGMSGLRAKGTWGYLKSIRCYPSEDAGITVTPDDTFGSEISEDRANTEYQCPAGEVAVGIKCSGEWCDDVSLKCAKVGPTRVQITSECYWSPKISDSDETEFTVPASHYVTGIRCSGGWCYQNTLMYCKGRTVHPSEVVANPKGFWQKGCAGADCKLTVEESFTAGKEAEESLTTEIRKHLSATVEVGYEAFGASGGLSMTGGAETATTDAKRILTTYQVGQTKTCEVNIDTTTYKIHAVWQWSHSATILGSPLTVTTCNVACTPDDSAPGFLPGSPQHIDSCRRPRS